MRQARAGPGGVAWPRPGDDLREANAGKEGAPFRYAWALVMAAAAVRTSLGVQYRQLSGLLAGMLGGRGAPHYSVLARRMARPGAGIGGGVVRVSGGGQPMTLLADSTGLKQCNRGEWIRKKREARRGFARLHLLADADTKKMPAAVVTDDRTGDSPMLKELLGTVAGPRDGKRQEGKQGGKQGGKQEGKQGGKQDRRMALIRGKAAAAGDPLPRAGSPPPNLPASGVAPLALQCGQPPGPRGARLIADGAYASRDNVRRCRGMGVGPIIPARVAPAAWGRGAGGAWGGAARGRPGGGPEARAGRTGTREREENARYREARKGYGRRRPTGITMSAFKGTSGDHARSRRWENIVQGVRPTAAQHDRWAGEAGAQGLQAARPGHNPWIVPDHATCCRMAIQEAKLFVSVTLGSTHNCPLSLKGILGNNTYETKGGEIMAKAGRGGGKGKSGGASKTGNPSGKNPH